MKKIFVSVLASMAMIGVAHAEPKVFVSTTPQGDQIVVETETKLCNGQIGAAYMSHGEYLDKTCRVQVLSTSIHVDFEEHILLNTFIPLATFHRVK